MRQRRSRGVMTWAMAGVVVAWLSGAAMARAQVPEEEEIPMAEPPAPKAKAKPSRAKAKRGGLKIPAAPAAAPKDAPAAKGAARKAAEPLMDPGKADDWPFHLKFKLSGFDGPSMNAVYYPARAGATAPVVLLVHEKGGLAKDFQDPIDALKGQGLADALQNKGYAVMLIDLRGGGAAGAGAGAGGTAAREKDGDLQQVYRFLIGCHNNLELNLAKFAAVALGDGANLAARWAQSPDGAISSEGRVSDLGALVMVSPMAGAVGTPRLEATLAALAPRLPLLLMAGEKDAASKDVIKASRPLVERQRTSKVVTYPTALHGSRMLRFEPEASEAILKFLDDTIKSRKDEWEPRYNLEPAQYSEPTVVAGKDAGRKPAKKAADDNNAKPAPKVPPAEPAPADAADDAPAAKPGRKKAGR